MHGLGRTNLLPNPMTRTVRISIDVPPSTRRLLKLDAASRGVTAKSILSHLIQSYLSYPQSVPAAVQDAVRALDATEEG